MEQLKKLVEEVISGTKTLVAVLEEAYNLGCAAAEAGESAPHVLSKLVGKNIFTRSVTHHYTGKLLGLRDGFLVLTDAAWIADDGRFSSAMEGSGFNEVEPYPDGMIVYVPITAMNDIVEYPHPLPRTVK